MNDKEKLERVHRMIKGLYLDMEYDHAVGVGHLEVWCLRLQKIMEESEEEVKDE